MKKIYLSFVAMIGLLSFNAQIANMNFESWTAGSGYNDPDGWTTFNQYTAILGISPNVVKLTTDFSEGAMAAETFTQTCANCPTYSLPNPFPGLINQSTGYYTNTATGVTFDYQYEGVSGDWGIAFAELTVWDATGDSSILIAQAADTIGATTTSWTSKTMNFNYFISGTTPDTINIYFISSAKTLINDPAFPTPQDGSTLRVDAVKINDPATAGISEANDSELNAFCYNNVLTVQLLSDERIPLTILDISGKVVLNTTTSGATTLINLDHLNAGIYIVNTGTGDLKKVKKILIE